MLELIVKHKKTSSRWKNDKKYKQNSVYLPVVRSISVVENSKYVITSSNPQLYIAKRLSVDIFS